MKKGTIIVLLTLVLSMMLSACSSSKEEAVVAVKPVKDIADAMITQIEQPALIALEANMVQQMYHLDPVLLEEYTIRTPMMNVKTNEIAILKVKDAKDVPAVEAAVKQRAEDVKKLFETYLQDQYENAKNYKLITKGNYILFVISESADELVKVYDSFFDQK